MDKLQITGSCEKFVKDYLAGVESGHNWYHISRVLINARKIYDREKRGDPFVIDIASLLHDIGDTKIDPAADGPGMVSDFLSESGASSGIIDQVVYIMNYISFRDSFSGCEARTAELDIVQDADRLDAIGAIGVARAFSYGGSRGNEIYIPGEARVTATTREEYRSSGVSTIGHFYEKLLSLKDMMNTETGRIMALERHQFMESFLEQFYREVGD
ncbi:MAG: HD domain-containing protein [Bacteroidia bacterium]|nr:MAG: HD domain-containing protein [Bacteroidia bacterium]